MAEAILLKIGVVFLLLVVSGLISGAETSLLSMGRRVAPPTDCDPGALGPRWIREMLRHPRRLLVAILIGNGCLSITVSVLAASLTEDAFIAGGALPLPSLFCIKAVAAIAIAYPLLLFLGDVLPKTIALMSPDRFSRLVAGPLFLFSRIIAPVRFLLERSSGGIVRLLLGASPSGEAPMTEHEFRTLVDRSKEGGVLRESEHRFIHNIFDFGETRVSELMTPRTDMVCLQVEQGFHEAMQTIEKHHFSRIPVYDKDKDDIVGILYSKDLLQDVLPETKPEEWRLQEVLRKPHFIPQAKKANDLFREFRANRTHMAIVVDEYGGVAGLVTMEDLLEELFGEIIDDYGPEEPPVRQLDERTLLIPARMAIEDFNRRMHAYLPDDEYDTVGGMVFDLFGKLPTPGSKVSYLGYTFVVEKVLSTRILELRVRIGAEGEEGVGVGPEEPAPSREG